MAYAVVQRDGVVPTLNQLKRAFRALPELRDLDAQTSAHDAYGIILRGLELGEAQVLQQALDKEGIATELVMESDLPSLPLGRAVREVWFEPDHLQAQDGLGRRAELLWGEILFVAAGKVRASQFKRVHQSLSEPLYRGSGISYDTVDDVRSREERREQLVADIFMVGGQARYSIAAESFRFSYLQGRLTPDPVVNLSYLVQDIAQFAPHAGLSRGAWQFREHPRQPYVYPSRGAYVEEIIWMLWRSNH